MREAFITINDVPTHIMAWGKWIEESFKENEKEVIILIPGNPGLPGFYTSFLSLIHENLGRNIPVWGIGHAGHDLPPPSGVRKFPKLLGNHDKFDLTGQVKSKIDFIKKYVPPNVKIYLISHSIGAWMNLELLKVPEIKLKVNHSYLICPTIERMAISPSVHFLGTGLKYMNPNVFENSIFLAGEEMKRVVDLDIATLEENKNKLTLFYSKSDGWVPIKYYEEILKKIPGIKAELDTNGVGHIFMKNPKWESVVADLVKESIKKDK